MMPVWAASIYWHLPVLLVVVSLVYSATRHDSWPAIRREAVRWAWRMTSFLGGIALVMYLLSLYL